MHRSAATGPENKLLSMSVEEKYKDIIDLPHHVSAKRPHMSAEDRAAQFAPFAALTGFDAGIREAARPTGSRIELDEDQKEIISQQLGIIAEDIASSSNRISHPVSVTYFVKDSRKSGGEYLTADCSVKKIDSQQRLLIMADGTQIPIADIYEIQR